MRQQETETEATSIRGIVKSEMMRFHTGLPAVVTKAIDPSNRVSVQPQLKAIIRKPDNKAQDVDYPLLVNVPVGMFRGGGLNMTFPIPVGTEGWLLFSDRAMDYWFAQGRVSSPIDSRMFDLNDCIFIPVPTSEPGKIPSWDTLNAQIKTDSGNAAFTLAPDGTLTIHSGLSTYIATPDGKIEITVGIAKYTMDPIANSVTIATGFSTVTITPIDIEMTVGDDVSLKMTVADATLKYGDDVFIQLTGAGIHTKGDIISEGNISADGYVMLADAFIPV